MKSAAIQEIKIGQEQAVIVPLAAWKRMIERLEELEDVKIYDQAKSRPGPRTITHDELCRQLGRSPLRYLRLQAGLSQTRLAQKTGLSQSYLARLEASQRKPSASARKKLARTLGVAENKLIF